jgi:hypothetical protein
VKKALLLNTLLIIGVLQLKAQQGLFKLSYLPGHTYSTVNTTHIKEEINYTGDTAIVNMTKKIGPPRGFEILRETTIENKVSRQNKKGLVSRMSVTHQSKNRETTSEGIERQLPVGGTKKETIYGYYDQEQHFHIDSVSGIKMNASLNVIYTEKLNETQANITFPLRTLKIGDSFTDNRHIYTPGAGLLDDMLAKTTYTLVAMQNEKAIFNTKTELSINMEGRQITMDMKGSGSGKMVYDMGVNYPLSIQNNINVTYTVAPMQGANVRMTGKLSISNDQQSAVTF